MKTQYFLAEFLYIFVVFSNFALRFCLAIYGVKTQRETKADMEHNTFENAEFLHFFLLYFYYKRDHNFINIIKKFHQIRST